MKISIEPTREGINQSINQKIFKKTKEATSIYCNDGCSASLNIVKLIIKSYEYQTKSND